MLFFSAFRWQRLFKVLLSVCLCLGSLGFWLNGTEGALAQAAPKSAETLFTVQCAACHAGGGNIIRRGKTLKQKALKRYGYDDVDAIAALVTKGKGSMPAFADRLTPDEIDAIAQYVLEQSESGW